MDHKVLDGITRLQKILPLETNLKILDAVGQSLYQRVIDQFRQRGAPPTVDELAQHYDNPEKWLQRLAAIDMLTLNEQGEVRGCYPFTTESRVHRIHLNGSVVHAMCALDTLAPSAMFDIESRVESECVVSGKPVLVKLQGTRVMNPELAGTVFFGIDWMAADSSCSCSDSLCTEMHFLIDQNTADSWVNEPEGEREIYNLEQAIEFSAGFFRPLVQTN